MTLTVSIFVPCDLPGFPGLFDGPGCVRKNQLVGIGRQMLHRHMHIASHHRLGLPAAQLLKHPGGHVILPQPARPDVSQIVPAEIRAPAGVRPMCLRFVADPLRNANNRAWHAALKASLVAGIAPPETRRSGARQVHPVLRLTMLDRRNAAGELARNNPVDHVPAHLIQHCP